MPSDRITEASQLVIHPLPAPFYDDGLITIFCGDSRSIVPQLRTFDLLLTDPPYGINVAKNGTVGSGAKPGKKRSGWKVDAPSTQFMPVTWDAAPPPAWELQMLISRASQAVLWGGNYFENLHRSSCWLVWDKVNGASSFADCELAWTNFHKAVRMFVWRWSGMLQQDMKNKEKRVHPTQKPVALMEWCISHAKAPKSILDPYMGSGTTLLAAQRLGIRAVGIDRERSYCEAAVDRLLADKRRTLPIQ